MDDFDRNVWCLLGLPFDAVTMEETVERIHVAVRTREKFVISTPNLNFLIASQKDPYFRNSVINSDLSVADGKPIIWIARLLNIPLPERVAGSDIIERLIENREEKAPIRVFFFGGQEGIAKKACEKLNAKNKGLHCVGFHNPGFGSIEDMSTPEIIDTINKSGADFIIVSLGARKGQAWIEYNKEKLEAPVMSHLGAVVNFVAGNVMRAPKLMQKYGLEWLWRIKEEPSLFKRYFVDGLSLIRLLLFKVIPYKIMQKTQSQPLPITSMTFTHDKLDDHSVITLEIAEDSNKIPDIFKNFLNNNIDLNIEKINRADGELLGFILLLRKNLALRKRTLTIKTGSEQNNKLFYYNCCDYLFDDK